MTTRRSLRKSSIITALSACLTFATISSVANADVENPDYDRMLQSVHIGIGGSGSIDTITDSRVSIGYGDDVAGETVTNEYNPAEAIKELPVRIIPSYVTEDGSGTDLSDLEGYTGRVEIFLSVQNLTLEPEDVSYDVAGQSHSRVALIGTPLTVVGASSLNVPVDQIAVNASSESNNITNGVLSQDEDGNAQLQWATILAPPQLPASTVFTIVADVEEFEAPEFDVTVQPGYVSNASTGEVLDQAFRSSLESDSDLILQTIQTMADLDDLLAEAGSIISQARSDLRVSAETVGSQTVRDLQQSIGAITTSTEKMISTLGSLETSVTSTLEVSNSALLSQTSQTISTVSSLLGNTEQATPYVEFLGEGCELRVANQADATSVFGSILNINALMNGYAEASADCQLELQQRLEAALGPEIPTAEACEESEGLTCQLEFSKSELAATLKQLEAEANEAVSEVESARGDDALGTMGRVNTSIGEIAPILEALESDGEPVRIRRGLNNIEDLLNDIEDGISDIEDRYNEILNRTNRVLDVNNGIEEQRIELKNAICGMIPHPEPEPTDPTAPSEPSEPEVPAEEAPLTEDEAEDLLRIIGSTDCENKRFFFNSGDTLESTIADANEELANLKEFVAPDQPVYDEDGNPVLDRNGNQVYQYESTQEIREYVDEAQATLESVYELYRTNNEVFLGAVRDLREVYDGLEHEATTLTTQVTELNDDVHALEENMATIFNDAQIEMKDQLDAMIDKSVRQVEVSKQNSGEAVDHMFGIISSEMSQNAAVLVQSGRDSISDLQGELASLGDVMSAQTEEQVRQGITAINGTVSAATVDLEASNLLLTNDIQRVLADIGVNSVEGGGLLGTIANSAATAGLADEQIAQASVATLEYANSQRGSLGRNAMSNAQLRATAARSELVDPFMIEPNPNIDYTTVYNFNVGGIK